MAVPKPDKPPFDPPYEEEDEDDDEPEKKSDGEEPEEEEKPMKNINSSKGASTSGKVGPIRSPMCSNLAQAEGKLKLNPSVAANTTRPGIAKQSAPIRSPMNGGSIVKY
jgi:hypothetical protein